MMRAISLVTAVALAACDPPSEGCAVPFDAGQIFVQTAGMEVHATGPVVVRGKTIGRPADVTVLKVIVAGVTANNDGGDYDSFDATIPIETLQSLAVQQGTPMIANLSVQVVTNCGHAIETTFEVPIVPRTATSLSIAAPSPANIPANGGAPSMLAVTASGDDAGMTIALTTTTGALDGVATENVVLAAPSDSCAMGTAGSAACATLLGAGKPGSAVVTARAPNTSPASATVNIFGPPLIVPGSIAIGAATTPVTVTDPGAPSFECTATPGTNLTIAGSGSSYTVSDNGAAGGTVATLTCVDPFGQTTVATYTKPK